MIENVGIIGAGQMGGGMAHVVSLSGRKVYLLDINDELGEKNAPAIREEGFLAEYLHCDLTSSKEVNNTFKKIESINQKIDILVNSAGGFTKQLTTDETPEEEWDALTPQVTAACLKEGRGRESTSD